MNRTDDWACPQCGALVPAGRSTCARCGQALTTESEADITRQRRETRRRFWRLYCWMYLGLGVCSSLAGLFLLAFPGAFSQGRAPDPFLQVIAGILLVFGLARIVSAGVQLRRLRENPSAPPKMR